MIVSLQDGTLKNQSPDVIAATVLSKAVKPERLRWLANHPKHNTRGEGFLGAFYCDLVGKLAADFAFMSTLSPRYKGTFLVLAADYFLYLREGTRHHVRPQRQVHPDSN